MTSDQKMDKTGKGPKTPNREDSESEHFHRDANPPRQVHAAVVCDQEISRLNGSMMPKLCAVEDPNWLRPAASIEADSSHPGGTIQAGLRDRRRVHIIQRDPIDGERIGRRGFQPDQPLQVGSQQLGGRSRRRFLPLRRLRAPRPLAHRPDRLRGRKWPDIHRLWRRRMLQPIAATGQRDRMPSHRREKHREPEPDSPQGGTGRSRRQRFATGTNGIHAIHLPKGIERRLSDSLSQNYARFQSFSAFLRRIFRTGRIGCDSPSHAAN